MHGKVAHPGQKPARQVGWSVSMFELAGAWVCDMATEISRRGLLGTAAATGAALATGLCASQAAETPEPPEAAFTLCLNTSTIRGQNVPLVDEVEIAAKAGYGAIEPWVGEIDKYVADGGSLADVSKRIRDHGLQVPSAIGFAEWIVDDDARRAKGLQDAQRFMDHVAQLGGTRIAAPPAGATDVAGMSLDAIASRYGALVELGQRMGITPQVELWGFSKSLSRVGEVAYVALESGNPRGLLLLDIYHLRKGGSEFEGLGLISPRAMQVFHINDYPAEPPPTELTDAHRVYPGDGVAPLPRVLRTLRENGFRGFLSLELFNREYWQQDAMLVARTGLEKMRSVVEQSLA